MRMNTKDLKTEYFKSGGPGGQHKNKRSMAVRLTHLPSGLTAVCREYRSQSLNKDTAMARLMARLALRSAKKKKRIPTRVPRGVRESTLDWKKVRSMKKSARRQKFSERDQ